MRKFNFTVWELIPFVILIFQVALLIIIVVAGLTDKILLQVVFVGIAVLAAHLAMKRHIMRLQKEFTQLRVDFLQIPDRIFVRMIDDVITNLNQQKGYWICGVIDGLHETPSFKYMIKGNIEKQLCDRAFITGYVRDVWGKSLDEEEAWWLRMSWMTACLQHRGMVNVNYVIKKLYPELTPNLSAIRR